MLRRSVTALVVVLALVFAGAGWYVSDQVIDGALRIQHASTEYDTEVVAVRDSEIVLRVADSALAAADRDAVMGLRWVDGYAQVGPTATLDGDAQTRPFTLLAGSQPPVGPDVVQFHGYGFPDDVTSDGPGFETVTYPGPLGELQAWYLPGRGSTWIVTVHGRGEGPAEFLRFVDAVGHLGYPTLAVTYRNDEGAPSTDGSLSLYGQEEWPDIAAAVDHAVAQGASDVVLYGMSMGGALALGYLLNGQPDVVRGLILESPAADLREAVRLRSGEALPVGGPVGGAVLAVGRAFVWLRTGLDFDTIDYVDRAHELTVPTLLFHGTDDTTMPFAVGRSLADARPDVIEFHAVEDGAHVRAWNEDPAGYTSTVTDFLERIGRDS